MRAAVLLVAPPGAETALTAESVARQTAMPGEVFVAGGGRLGSGDEARLEAAGVTVRALPGVGPLCAIDRAAAESRADAIFLLEAGSTAYPQWIERMTETCAAADARGVSLCGYERVGRDGRMETVCAPCGPDEVYGRLAAGGTPPMSGCRVRTADLAGWGGAAGGPEGLEWPDFLRRCADRRMCAVLPLVLVRTAGEDARPAASALFTRGDARAAAAIDRVLAVARGEDVGGLRAGDAGRFDAALRAAAGDRRLAGPWRKAAARASLRLARAGRPADAARMALVCWRTGSGGDLLRAAAARVRARRDAPGGVPVGRVDFGSLGRTTPINRTFGFGRAGVCLDRYYIERFIGRHRSAVRGSVLEVGSDEYTRRFGAGVERADVLHVVPGSPGASVVADLARAPGLPDGSYDCVILTQTLLVVYDVRAAVETIHRILKPGGVVLATAPGVCKISRGDMMRWGDFWRFTDLSLRRLFAEFFGPEGVTVESFGNVLAAAAYLHGLVVEDVGAAALEERDDDYPIVLGVRAVKGGGGGGSLRRAV